MKREKTNLIKNVNYKIEKRKMRIQMLQNETLENRPWHHEQDKNCKKICRSTRPLGETHYKR